PPCAHGVPAGCWQAWRSAVPVSVRAKNSPSAGLVTGVVAVTTMSTSATVALAPSVTPPAVMVITTVLLSGSSGSRPQLATPASRGVHDTNVNVPGSSVGPPITNASQSRAEHAS